MSRVYPKRRCATLGRILYNFIGPRFLSRKFFPRRGTRPFQGRLPKRHRCHMMLQSAQSKLPGELETQRPILGHIIIEAVEPAVDGGRYPAKRIVGEPCVVEADIFRDGHQIIRAALKYRRKSDESFAESPMMLLDNDRWRGEFVPNENARYVYTIEGVDRSVRVVALRFQKESRGRTRRSFRPARGRSVDRENDTSRDHIGSRNPRAMPRTIARLAKWIYQRAQDR